MLGAVLLPAVLLSAVLLPGCGDEAKTPVGGDLIVYYLPQTSAANVLANLRQAYAERKIDEYRKLFTDDFTFVFNPLDPEDLDHPNPDSWGLVDELQATRNMFADSSVTKIELTSYVLGAIERADSIHYGPRTWKQRVEQVNLQVATRLPNGGTLTLVVEGTTETFFFREDPTKPIQGRPAWFIFRWEDHPSGPKTENKTWGQIKAVFF